MGYNKLIESDHLPGPSERRIRDATRCGEARRASAIVRDSRVIYIGGYMRVKMRHTSGYALRSSKCMHVHMYTCMYARTESGRPNPKSTAAHAGSHKHRPSYYNGVSPLGSQREKKRKERLLGTAAEQLLGGDRLYGRRTPH